MSSEPFQTALRRPRLGVLDARHAWACANALQCVFTVLLTALGILPALLVRVLSGSARWPLRAAATLWAPVLLRGAGARLSVEGAERIDWSRPLVLVANHQSMIDIPVLFRTVPVPLRFVLKRELGALPFLGWYVRAMGMVPIDRGRTRAARASLAAAAALVRGGACLCVFPEGTRSRDGRVGAYKPGAFQVAIEAGAAVVPVAIEGSAAVLSPNALFRVRPGAIRVRFGAPIVLGADAERGALAAAAHAATLALLQAPSADAATRADADVGLAA